LINGGFTLQSKSKNRDYITKIENTWWSKLKMTPNHRVKYVNSPVLWKCAMFYGGRKEGKCAIWHQKMRGRSVCGV